MVTVTQLVLDHHIPVTFAEAYIEPRNHIHIPVCNDKGRFVADVTGTYIMLRIIQALEYHGEPEDTETECDQIEPYDALQDAWSRCREEPFDSGCVRWVKESQVQECIARVKTLIDSYGDVVRVEFEVPIAWDDVYGRADCVVQYNHGEMIVFEFKCVQELLEPHRAQTAIYAHMLQHVRGCKVRGVLFNVLSNEIQELYKLPLFATTLSR